MSQLYFELSFVVWLVGTEAAVAYNEFRDQIDVDFGFDIDV